MNDNDAYDLKKIHNSGKVLESLGKSERNCIAKKLQF